MRYRRQAVVALSLAAVAGCTLAAQSEAAAPSSSAASEVQVLALAKEVVNCMRSNGLPGFPPRGPMAAEDLEKLEQWTACARSNGFPDWPDPDETGTYHLGAVRACRRASARASARRTPGGRPEDAAFRTVLDACREFEVQGMAHVSSILAKLQLTDRTPGGDIRPAAAPCSPRRGPQQRSQVRCVSSPVAQERRVAAFE